MSPATVAFEHPTTLADELGGRPGLVRFLEVPRRRFVRIDGNGAAGEAAFTPRMPGLYATAWSLRFALKARRVVTKVGPLEGLWWTADGATDLDAIFADGPRDTWRWTLQIGLPDEARDDELATALGKGREKFAVQFRGALRIETFDEGDVAQVLHLGPYDAERPTIERLHEAIAAAGLVPRDRHHELYLGDPRRSEPGRLKTILRQPVAAG
jgi:hypothetical protein